MGEVIIGFLTAVLQSETAFVFFSFFMLITEGIVIWALVVVLMNKLIELRRKELGMNEVDQAIMNIFKMMNSHFLTKAREIFGDDYFNRKETALYRYLLTIALDERKPTYRERIRRNHFNEKSASEWSKYVSDCISEDINSVTNYLDSHYHPQARIPRPDLYEWNKQIIDNAKQEISHLFERLLTIAEDNKLKKFFGIKLSLGGL